MTNIPEKCVFFAHGKESGPWGTKIVRLAEVARARGFAVESPDYSGEMDADRRAAQLLALRPQAGQTLVLAGSSMGGYVSTVAAQTLRPQGLFLLAPAFYIPGYVHQEPRLEAHHTVIVHGWQDDIVPVDHSIRFARQYRVPLHILDSGHRLTDVLPQIETMFGAFLDEMG